MAHRQHISENIWVVVTAGAVVANGVARYLRLADGQRTGEPAC